MPEKAKAETKAGVDDFSIEQIDGAKAYLKLGSETRLVDQADLFNVQKQVAKGIQVTY